jgi:oligoribonuclease
MPRFDAHLHYRIVDVSTVKELCRRLVITIHCEHSHSIFSKTITHTHTDPIQMIFLYDRWYPSIFVNAPPKTKKHRALEDIKESIAELKYYREQIFIPSSRK